MNSNKVIGFQKVLKYLDILGITIFLILCISSIIIPIYRTVDSQYFESRRVEICMGSGNDYSGNKYDSRCYSHSITDPIDLERIVGSTLILVLQYLLITGVLTVLPLLVFYKSYKNINNQSVRSLTFHIIATLLGLITPLTIIFSVLLIIRFFNIEVRKYYGILK